MPNKYVLLILLVFGFALPGFCQYTIRGRVIDAQNKQPLEFVTVQLPASELWAVSNEKGAFVLTRVPRGKSVISVKYLGYAPKTLEVDVQADVDNLLIALTESNLLLGEVVVTASESKGMTSASKIGQIAMQHLQPTSFTDLLELLPGGKSVDPNMGSANFIKIREAGSASSMSSLGVGFVIDGAQVNTDANLQYLQGTAQGGKESVSQGVDMRTLSTDNIESVEIVRGIPSVEYGNLTNGLVNIRRKATASLLTARIKADQVGKLFSAGKGWNVAGGNVLNVDLNYLDSKVDPRDSRENYQRITASARLNNRHRVGSGYVNRRINVDYTGSFDDVKRDKDVTAKEDSYKSSYDKMSASGEWNWTLDVASLLRSLRANAAISQEISKISERKSVFIDRPMGIPSSLVEGVADGLYLPYQYIADMVIDGKPLYVSAKLMADFAFKAFETPHTLKIGAEWNLSKNFGNGQVYDITRPLQTASTIRPRNYNDIPARQDFSLFAEKPLFVRFANHEVLLSAGIRANTLLGLSSEYAMSGKVYFDPRLNLKWTLPVFGTDNDWEIDFSAGIGWLSKFPTTAQLYPDAKYYDVVQLNYYHNNPDFRRINLRTYKWDNTNFDLTPARNRKWEVRLNLEHRGTEFSLTYFRERMNNAFRNISYYKLFPYINYDGTSINSSTLTAPPALEVLTSKQDTLINTFNQTGNGTRIYKQGVEFTFHTPRVNALKTRFTLTGAWLRTTNSTRMPTYDESTVLIGGEQLRYVGLYDWEDGSVRESFGTNVTADTYLQQIGMTLSLTAQCTWLTSSEPLWNSGVPISYVDKSGQSHPFTEADKGNAQLRQLVHLYSEGYFKATTVPFESAINLKASKKIGSHILLSLFVNRIAHIAPSYHRGSMLIRRSSNPYFGMEANLTF